MKRLSRHTPLHKNDIIYPKGAKNVQVRE